MRHRLKLQHKKSMLKNDFQTRYILSVKSFKCSNLGGNAIALYDNSIIFFNFATFLSEILKPTFKRSFVYKHIVTNAIRVSLRK